MSVFSEQGNGMVPVTVYQVTAAQLEELVERIALRVTEGPRKDSVKVAEAARLLQTSEDALRKRIRAKLVATLPNLGPKRISMDEIDRLNGLRKRGRK